MPPMGPPGRKNDFKKPKNAKQTFTRILKYMGKNKLFLIVVFIMLILSTVCNIAASYCLKPILNDVAAAIKAGTFMDEGIKTLVKNLIKLSILYVGASLFSFAQSKIMVILAYKTTNLIRKDLFDHMQTLPLRFFDSKTHGEIMSRFTNDVDNVQMMLEQSMVQLVSSAFTFVGIVAMMIVLSPTLFAFALIFLIIMLITVSQIGKKSRKYFRLQQKNLGVMNGNIEESVEGMKVIKVFNHEQQAFDEFEETNESFRKAATNANFFSGIMGPCSTGINNASYATIALVGGLLALTGSLDIGTFFTFLSYSKQFTQPINQIANQMNTVFSALAGAERVFEIMDMSPEIDDGTVTLSEEKTADGKKWFWLDGDTVYFDGMAQTIDTYHPDVIVLNCCEATMPMGRLIMNLNDVEIICKKAPNATIIATHLDSVNHALLSSDDVRAFAARKKLTQLHVPANGEWIILP